MRASKNLPLPHRIYHPFQQLYATLPDYTPPSQKIPLPVSTILQVRPSQNLPLSPRIYMYPSFQRLYTTLPESTPFQNIPTFSTTICDPPRIYHSLLEYTLFWTTIIICDPLRIYPSLPEYAPHFNNYDIMRPPPPPPSIYPSQNITPVTKG